MRQRNHFHENDEVESGICVCLDIIICRSIFSAIMRPSDVPYMQGPTNSFIKFNRLFRKRLNQRELVGGDVKGVDVGGKAGVGLLGAVRAVLC